MADDLSGLRSNRDHAGCIQAVHRFTRPRIVRLRVADAPVDQIEFGIVGARSPRRPTAELPGVAALRPRLRAWFTWRGNRVSTPQLLAGLRIPAVEEPARRGFSTRHPGNEHAVGDDGCAGGVVAFLRIGELLIPDLLARLHVEREHVVVDRDAEDLAVVDRRRASSDRGALDSRLELHRRTPELTTGRHIDRERRLAIDDVHDTVVDRRGGQLAHVVHETRAPYRHEPLDGLRVDLIQRAVAAASVAHALRGDVVGIAAVVHQFVGGLREGGTSTKARENRQRTCFLHVSLLESLACPAEAC